MAVSRKPSSIQRPLVGIFADGAFRYGRDVVMGAVRYANAHRRWEVYGLLRQTAGTRARWPACDGAIIGGVTADALEAICASSDHVISCSGSMDPRRMPTVSVDDVAIGTIAAQHLLECGLKSFSYYGVPGKRASDTRESSLKAAVAAQGHSMLPCPFVFPGWTDSQSEQPWIELVDWLMELPKPIGILAVDDAAAGYLASACQHAGIIVPEQIAIVGVNNDEILCEMACTPITSVDAGFARAGYAAAVMLDRLLNGERLTKEQRTVKLAPLGIVKRLSTDLFAVDDPQLADIVRYIRVHACDPCSVDDVAQATAIGRRNLERRFLTKLGRTPGEEILRVQMETAKRLLLQPGLSLAVVAERCGFSGMPAFSRAFHRVNAETPSEYRRMSQTAYS